MGRSKQDGAGFLPRASKAKLNAPPAGQPWSWMTLEMMNSDAFRSLSINARRVLDRIQIEHGQHRGLENGRLKVTWNNFVKFGVGRRFIKRALGDLLAAGLIAIVQPGRRPRGQDRGDPTQYRLTYLPVAEPNDFFPPTNEWKNFKSEIVPARLPIRANARKTNGEVKGKKQAWTMPS